MAKANIDTLSKRVSNLSRTVRTQKRTIASLMKAEERMSYGTNGAALDYRENKFRPTAGDDFMQLYETYGHVFACVDAIARNCASVPLKIFQLKKVTSTKDRLGDEITDGPWWSLLNTPNKFTSGNNLVYSMIAFQQLVGTSYLEKVGSNPSEPVELWSLRPDWMRIKPDAKNLIGGYEYEVDGQIVIYTPEEIFRFKSWHPRSELYGLAPISPAQNSIITDLYSIKYTKQFFKQGGHLNWYLSVKEELDDFSYKRLEQQLKTKFAGLENSHAPAIVDGAGEIKEIGGSPDKNTLLPQKTLSRKEVCEVYGVPPIILGFLDEATYNNSVEQKVIFWEQKAQPLLNDFVASLNRDLFWENDMEVVPDYSGISVLQPSYTEKANSGKVLIDGRIMKPNEVRQKLFAMDPIDGGDEFPQASGGFGFQMNKGAQQPSELPLLVKVIELLLDKGGMGSGHHGHYPSMNGAGSAKGLTDERMKDIEKDFVSGQFINAYDKLRGYGLDSDTAKRIVNEGKTNIYLKPILEREHVRTKKTRSKEERDIMVKAVLSHRDRILTYVYKDVERWAVDGFKDMGTAVMSVVNGMSKAVAVVKKDVVAEAIASLDPVTKRMAQELLKTEKGLLKKVISDEFKRVKKADIDKETLERIEESTDKWIGKMVDQSMKHVSQTTKDRVESKFTAMLESDTHPNDMRKDFQEMFEGTDREGPTWARTVARTEALKFTESSRFNTMSEMGFEKKEWIHSGQDDEMARPDHVAADGEIVAMKDKFSTGLLYPGDPVNGDAESLVNCKCSVIESIEAAVEEE